MRLLRIRSLPLRNATANLLHTTVHIDNPNLAYHKPHSASRRRHFASASGHAQAARTCQVPARLAAPAAVVALRHLSTVLRHLQHRAVRRAWQPAWSSSCLLSRAWPVASSALPAADDQKLKDPRSRHWKTRFESGFHPGTARCTLRAQVSEPAANAQIAAAARVLRFPQPTIQTPVLRSRRLRLSAGSCAILLYI